MGALSDLYDPNEILWRGCPCGLHASMFEHQAALGAKSGSRFYAAETTEGSSQPTPREPMGEIAPVTKPADRLSWKDQDRVMANLAESAIMRGIFGSDMNRRNFLRAVGGTTAAAAIGSILPVDKAIANILEANGPLEKNRAQRRLRADHLRNAHHHGLSHGVL